MALKGTVHDQRAGRRPSADLVILPSGSAYVINHRLRRPGRRTETYQLWGVEQGRTVSLGLLGNHPGEVAVHGGRRDV